MAEFEVFGESKKDEPKKKNGKKNLFKNKWFLIAVGVVSVFALIKLFSRKEETGQNMVIADGLQGVSVSQPLLDEGNQSAYSSGTFDAMYEAFTDQLTDIKNSYDIQIDSMSEQLYTVNNKLNTQSEVLNRQADTIARQNDIQAMQNNSDAYIYATSDARRQALHNANQKIASKYGWIFNNGAWYDETGTNRLYTTATQEYVNPNSSLGGKSSSTSVATVKSVTSAQSDIATMKANSQAWHNASSQAEKDSLNAQNKAIAQKNNWTFNSQTGTYHDATGKQVY